MLGWIVLSVLGLLLLVVVALHIPRVQQFLTSQVENYLEEQLETNVSIGRIFIALPKTIRITDLYLEDRQMDTLIYSGRLDVDIGLFGLIRNKINVNSVSLHDFYANIERVGTDTTFNYEFIIDAFTGDDPAPPPDDNGSDWQISVGTIDLQSIRLNYNDELMGNHFALDLGRLEVEMDDVDIEQNAYSVRKISLSNTDGSFRISRFVPDTVAVDESSDLELSIGEIVVENVGFTYHNEVAGQTAELHIGDLLALAREFSLLRQEIAFSEIQLDNSRVSYQQDPIPVEDSLMMARYATVDDEESIPWNIVIDNLAISLYSVRYNDNHYEHDDRGMDFNHLGIELLNLEATDFAFRGTEIQTEINQLTFLEQSGFVLQEFRTQLAFTDQRVALDDLYIQTGHSQIQNHFSLQYPSMEIFTENPGTAQLHLELTDTYIGFRDLLYFAPDMAEMPPFPGNEDLRVNAQALVTGRVGDLSIDRFSLDMLSTSLDVRGRVTGLPETDEAFFDITRFRLTSTANDLHQLAVPDSIVHQYQLPQRMVLTATYSGTMDNFSSQAFLNTTLGDLRAEMSMIPGERYRGGIDIDELQLGTIMRNDTVFGPVSLNLEFEGQGFSVEEMNTSIDLVVQQAVFNQYNYQGLNVQGRINEAVFNGYMNYEDSNLHFNFKGLFSLDLDTPKYDMTLDILAANLKNLNITDDEIAFRGALVADISGNHINNINGDIGIRNVLIIKDRETYRIDSLLFASITGDRHTRIKVDSDILTASFEGTINLTDLAPVLTRHLNQYYTFGDVVPPDTLLEQNFEFQILLHNPELLTEVLVPGIERFVPGYVTGSYDSRADNLHIDILIPQLVYENYTIDTMTFYVDSDPDFLNFGSSISRFALGNFEVTNLAVVGQVYNDIIESRMQITDQEFMEQYSMGGIFSSLEDGFRFHMDPTQLILNYNRWDLPDDNYIELSERPVYVNNLILTRNDERLAINTTFGDQADSVLNVEFANFMLETITQLVQSDTTVLTGFLNGFVRIDQEAPQLVFTSDLNVQDIYLMGYEVGNLVMLAESQCNQIDVDVSLAGNQNSLSIAGHYVPLEETNEISFAVDLQQLNLASFTGPLQGKLTDPTGFIRGSLQIGGSTENPNITGALTFDEAVFLVDYLNTRFSVTGQRMVFDENGIRFSQFVIVDERGNRARINGQVLTQNYTDYNFDLAINANNFVVLNTSEGDSELFYGRVVIDLEMQVSGSMGLPNVVMEVRVKEETNLTYVLEEVGPVTVEIDGLVEFIVPRDSPERVLMDAADESNQEMTVEFTGINLIANVLVERNAALRIIVDPDAGDYLVARANPSSLNLNIDQVGNIALTGTFEIGSGAYQLSFYDIVRRRFDIQQGSQITWLGDPMNAEINITAIHTVQTPPAGIMAGDDERFRRPLPVQALLNMQGSLMSPEITFALNVDDDQTGAIANAVRDRFRMMDEGDINRQVFALLVLQRFLAENPLEGPGTGGIEATARNSVSQILTSQLNRLTRQLGGFDIAFDLQTQQARDGYETQLDVQLSRTLFDDRLRIRVGGNIELERTEQVRQEQDRRMGDYIGDIVVEYLLTPSGDLILQFFREHTYDIFYADLIETGAGIIYNRSFNRLRELLNPREEDVEQDEARQ